MATNLPIGGDKAIASPFTTSMTAKRHSEQNAKMPEKDRGKVKIEPYRRPSVGWGAARAVARLVVGGEGQDQQGFHPQLKL